MKQSYEESRETKVNQLDDKDRNGAIAYHFKKIMEELGLDLCACLSEELKNTVPQH